MKYIFLLSGDYIDIAKEEALSLLDLKKVKLAGKLLIAYLNGIPLKNQSKRLALTKNIYKFLFQCNTNDVEKSMKNFDWNSVYKDNFCIRVHFMDGINNNSIKNNEIQKNIRATTQKQVFRFPKSYAFLGSGSSRDRSKPHAPLSEKNLAKYIWRSVKRPKVELENPKTLIQLFMTKKKAYCGLLIFENKGDFEARKSHLRPFPSPSSLHPKLARALVNISGVKKDEILLDPFCGAGGFLIEAGLMNIKAIGCDINKIMTEGCKKNLKYFKINNCKLKTKNALDISNKFDCLVTDLPYGLNSNVVSEYHKGNWKLGRINKKIQKEGFTEDLGEFYLQFLKNLRKKIRKKAVIIFPSYVNYRSLLKKSRFKIEKEFSNYVHGSLTRKIVKVS